MKSQKPSVRLRRLRRLESIRRLVKGETDLQTSNLIAPVFVRYGEKVVEPIEAMPGINRYSADRLESPLASSDAGQDRSPVRDTCLKRRVGKPGLFQRRCSPEGDSGGQEERPLDARRGGCLPLRVHVSRSLRSDSERAGGQRRDAPPSREGGGRVRKVWSRYRGAERYDGRAGGHNQGSSR